MDITTVGIVGAGTMGAGIATCLATHGLEVRLYDTQVAAVARAIDAIAGFCARAVEKGRLAQAEANAAVGRARGVGELAALADVGLVIEAVFEDAAIKGAVLRELSSLLAPTALVATNTSCLRVTDLARHVVHPERFLGLHYFSPAAINPIVEVVRGERTGAATLELATAFCRATGKRPLLCRDSYGFAINRFFCPYSNEAVRLLDEGLGDPASIDAAARIAVGAAAGPFAVMNIIKPRINLDAVRNLAPLGPFYAPAASLITLGEAGGTWDIGAAPAPETALTPIVDRLRAAVFLPVLEELDDAVATPEDIDMGAREALRFAEPPCALMDRLGRDEVARLVAPLAARYGHALPRALERVGSLTAGTR
jgi:3-hydroxyacyl-CoA dehydrogenase